MPQYIARLQDIPDLGGVPTAQQVFIRNAANTEWELATVARLDTANTFSATQNVLLDSNQALSGLVVTNSNAGTSTSAELRLVAQRTLRIAAFRANHETSSVTDSVRFGGVDAAHTDLVNENASGDLRLKVGTDIVLSGASTGTAPKVGFFGNTPITRPDGSSDVLQSLVDLGLREVSSDPPLNLGTGDLTAGLTSVGSFSATSITATGTIAVTDDMTITDAKNILLGSTTGTKIGTATTQKLGFFNATPIVQPSGDSDILVSLVNLGLRDATDNPPLNLGTGALTAGTTSVGSFSATAITGTGTVALTDDMTVTDAKNIILNATTGTKIGTATTQKLGFFNATPVIQQAGNSDVLASLVTLGLRAASDNPPLNLGTGSLTAGTTAVGSFSATAITATGAVDVTDHITVTDGKNIVLNATTGTKIGTATTQKLGFFNATPVVQQAGNSDVLASLVTLGFRAASDNPPLNLGTGNFTAGTTSVGSFSATAITATGAVDLTDHMTVTDGKDIVLNTTTGTKIGTAVGQKLSFHGSTPVVQRASASQASVDTTGASNVTPWGYSTEEQANAIVTLLNEIRAALVEKGIIKGSA
jgi:hypothetical protein